MALAALALLVTGCDGGSPVQTPDDIEVEVDTPALRQQKAEAGIDDCRPGPGGGALPELTLPCLGGGPDVGLHDLKGPLLINIWWSGCGPCRREMPAIQAFYEQHGDRVDVLGVDVETYPGAAIGFAETVGATYPQLADPGAFIFDQADLRVAQVFPQSLVVDADGEVARIEAVEFTSVDEVEQFVEDSLGVTL